MTQTHTRGYLGHIFARRFPGPYAPYCSIFLKRESLCLPVSIPMLYFLQFVLWPLVRPKSESDDVSSLISSPSGEWVSGLPNPIPDRPCGKAQLHSENESIELMEPTKGAFNVTRCPPVLELAELWGGTQDFLNFGVVGQRTTARAHRSIQSGRMRCASGGGGVVDGGRNLV